MPLTAAIVIVRDASKRRNSACARSSRSRPVGRVELGERLDVGAGAEQRRVRGGDDHRPRAAVDLVPRLLERLDHRGRERVGRRVVEPQDGELVAAAVELDGRGLVAGLGLRVGVEALAGLRAQAPLGDEPAQDERRREVLAPLLLGPLERGEHLVEPAEVRAGERPGHHARAHHQAEVDLAHPGDALLEHEAGLDDRLEREALGDALVELGLRLSAHRTPSRSWRRAPRARGAPPCPGGRRSGRRRRRACRAPPSRPCPGPTCRRRGTGPWASGPAS